MKQVTEEAERLDLLAPVAKMLRMATQVEKLTAKLYEAWKQMNNLSDRIFTDTGASNPNLRSLLQLMDTLGNNNGHITVPCGEEFVSLTFHLPT